MVNAIGVMTSRKFPIPVLVAIINCHVYIVSALRFDVNRSVVTVCWVYIVLCLKRPKMNETRENFFSKNSLHLGMEL